MSIRDRIFRVARSNLNSLLEKAAEAADPRRRLGDISDAELERELELRRKERVDEARVRKAKAAVDGLMGDRATRERDAGARRSRVEADRAQRTSARTAADRAARDHASRNTRSQGSTRSSAGPSPGAGSRRTSSAGSSRIPFGRRKNAQLEKYFQILELPSDSSFTQVKSAYRRLMRKYHPDFHRGSPEKHRAAVEVSQSLTDAYNNLERALKR